MDRNNLAYWFPILQRAGVPVPETQIIHTDVELIHLLDGKEPEGFSAFETSIRAACDAVGYPAFLRTGHFSDKHSWERTCFVRSANDIIRHVCNLVESSECAGFLGLPYSTWVVRRFIPLASSFTAFRGFPVNRERRYFIRGGCVLCHHPYWPAAAVEQVYPSDPRWREKLVDLNHESDEEVIELSRQSCIVSDRFEGAWSLDWAMDRDGKWWAIDMAEAERSFHWPGCPENKPKEPQ